MCFISMASSILVPWNERAKASERKEGKRKGARDRDRDWVSIVKYHSCVLSMRRLIFYNLLVRMCILGTNRFVVVVSFLLSW